VISKKGRDKGALFVVLNVATERGSEFAWVSDGRKRSVERLKKKNTRHLQPTKFIDCSFKDRLGTKKEIKDLDIRKVIKAFEESSGEEE